MPWCQSNVHQNEDKGNILKGRVGVDTPKISYVMRAQERETDIVEIIAFPILNTNYIEMMVM